MTIIKMLPLDGEMTILPSHVGFMLVAKWSIIMTTQDLDRIANYDWGVYLSTFRVCLV